MPILTCTYSSSSPGYNCPCLQLSLEQLVDNGVHCLKPEYIADYLAKGSALRTESLYINEAKALLKRSELCKIIGTRLLYIMNQGDVTLRCQ